VVGVIEDTGVAPWGGHPYASASTEWDAGHGGMGCAAGAGARAGPDARALALPYKDASGSGCESIYKINCR
jgi:hypothetical protein